MDWFFWIISPVRFVEYHRIVSRLEWAIPSTNDFKNRMLYASFHLGKWKVAVRFLEYHGISPLMYIYIYSHIIIYISMYIYMYIYIYRYRYISVYIYIYIHTWD